MVSIPIRTAIRGLDPYFQGWFLVCCVSIADLTLHETTGYFAEYDP